MPAFDSNTTRMPGGLTNAAPWQTMGSAGLPDPSWAHVYHNDFDTYLASDWAFSNAGASSYALTQGDGGFLTITTDAAAANNGGAMQTAGKGFRIDQGRQAFFKFSGQISDATNAGLMCGFVAALAAPSVIPNDGVFFFKPTGTALPVVYCRRAGATLATITLPASCTLSSGVQFELGLLIDPSGNIAVFFNPTTGDNTQINASAGMPRGYVAALRNTGSTVGNFLPTANLAPSFGVFTNTTAIRTLSADYVTAVRER